MPLIRFLLIARSTNQFVAIILMAIFITGCSEPDYIPETFLDEPVWLASTKAPTVTTTKEVRKLWHSENRNAKVLYKTCYMAIANDRRNEELVELCLSLMRHDMPKEIRRTIHDHYLKNYFYHKASTQHCTNCLPGDKVAIVSRDYARSISYAGNYRGARAAIHRVLNERGDEISPYVQMDLYQNIAWYHVKSSITPVEFSALEDVYARFEPQKNSTRAGAHNHKRLGKVIEQLRELVPNDL